MTGSRLPALAAAFGLGAALALLLGLDAAAEMPADVRRVSVLIGTGLGALALAAMSAALVTLHGRRAAAIRRAEARRQLHEALDDLAAVMVERLASDSAAAPRRRRRA